GEEITTSWAFLLRLVPDDMIFIVAMVYVLQYRRIISKNQRFWLYTLICFMSFSIFITGSKVFIILLGLSLFIGYLFKQYLFNIIKITIVSFICIALVVVSF